MRNDAGLGRNEIAPSDRRGADRRRQCFETREKRAAFRRSEQAFRQSSRRARGAHGRDGGRDAGTIVAGAGAFAAPPPDPHLPLFLPLPAGTRGWFGSYLARPRAGASKPSPFIKAAGDIPASSSSSARNSR